VVAAPRGGRWEQQTVISAREKAKMQQTRKKNTVNKQARFLARNATSAFCINVRHTQA
jgi:hypothetical protein